ncbi:hypothetical protein ACTXGO_00990 [Psychrobacter sp. T6-1]|uniref:hypothetical protein n=1 Tax=Psychrobacter sp. T6-1 TaxID=3457447 RepID=UPI003FD1BC2C
MMNKLYWKTSKTGKITFWQSSAAGDKQLTRSEYRAAAIERQLRRTAEANPTITKQGK